MPWETVWYFWDGSPPVGAIGMDALSPPKSSRINRCHMRYRWMRELHRRSQENENEANTQGWCLLASNLVKVSAINVGG